MANVETRRNECTFLGSGCHIRTHLLCERRLDYQSILSRSGREAANDEEAAWLSNGWEKKIPLFLRTDRILFRGTVDDDAKKIRSEHLGEKSVTTVAALWGREMQGETHRAL